MYSTQSTFLFLVGPAIGGALLILLGLAIRRIKSETQIAVSFMGLTINRIPVKSVWIVKGLIIFLGSLMFLSYSFRDYSKYFPSYLDMDVYFDDDGVDSSFEEFSSKELKELRFAKDWVSLKKQFLDHLDSLIEAKIGSEKGIFCCLNRGEGWVHSSGATSLKIKATKEWQTYHLKEATGYLVHTLERPNMIPTVFKSEFSLLDSSLNYIRASLGDIYFRYAKVLRAKFKQAMSSAESELFDFTVIGVTKIRFFPLVVVKRTIYCIESNKGELVPIAYAVYRPR